MAFAFWAAIGAGAQSPDGIDQTRNNKEQPEAEFHGKATWHNSDWPAYVTTALANSRMAWKLWRSMRWLRNKGRTD
jgi:hypothetical protein